MKIHQTLGTCVAGMVRSFARAVRKRKKPWRENAAHKIPHREIAGPVNSPQGYFSLLKGLVISGSYGADKASEPQETIILAVFYIVLALTDHMDCLGF